ncbi:serine/threonine-protein kinase [Streptomyces sp. NPDC057575]|uniref:serine/threonine-protein kinase n=1 Tax=unclassified Streptomyces TaxID=2593676 RepID=UPI0036A9C45F
MLRERVLREARSLARLHHPHVVTIHHIVDRADTPHPWLVMELVTGGSLQDRLDQGPLSPAEAARVGRGVLAGLRAAHAAGIHHRDVKPVNVLLREDGTPVLTDFGIAALPEATRLTATGDLIGSPEFIAPERVRGVEGDPASDLWSLGMMLYVALEGHSPLRRTTSMATLTAVLDEPIPPPVRSGPLAPVLSALLQRDPAARPDAEQLDRLLAEAESGQSAGAPAYGFGPRPDDAEHDSACDAWPCAPLSRLRRGGNDRRPVRHGSRRTDCPGSHHRPDHSGRPRYTGSAKSGWAGSRTEGETHGLSRHRGAHRRHHAVGGAHRFRRFHGRDERRLGFHELRHGGLLGRL